MSEDHDVFASVRMGLWFYVFIGVTHKMCKYAQDVQAGLSLTVYVVHVLLERRASVICTRICTLKSVACSLEFYSLFYGVISEVWIYYKQTFSLFVVIQFCNSCKYTCCLAALSCL